MISGQTIISFLSEIRQYISDNGVQNDCSGISSLYHQKEHSLTWTNKDTYDISKLKSSILIAKQGFIPSSDRVLVIQVKDPRYSFAKIVRMFFFSEKRDRSISKKASIASTAVVGDNASIAEGVVIGERCVIGKNVTIHCNVVLYDNVKIGNDVVIKAGAAIGGDGFGYVRSEHGYEQLPHLGGVVIGDNVEIGSNTCIDRGVIDNTVIGDGTKIDNLCHIAHNVTIGENCIITAATEISGSVTCEDDVWIAPNACIREKVVIHRNSLIGIGSVVIRDVPPDTTVCGNPAKKIGERPFPRG